MPVQQATIISLLRWDRLALEHNASCITAQVGMAEVLALAAAAEVSSEHPLASAIFAHAQAALAPLPSTPPAADAAGNIAEPSGGSSASYNGGTGGRVGGEGSRGPVSGGAALRRGGERDLSWVRPSSYLEVLPGRCVSTTLTRKTWVHQLTGPLV